VTEATRLRLEAERKRRQAETAFMYAESRAYAASLHAERSPISPAAATGAPKRSVSAPDISAKPGAADSRQDTPRAAESVASVPPQVSRPAATVAPSSQQFVAAASTPRRADQPQEGPVKSQEVAPGGPVAPVPKPPVSIPEPGVSRSAKDRDLAGQTPEQRAPNAPWQTSLQTPASVLAPAKTAPPAAVATAPEPIDNQPAKEVAPARVPDASQSSIKPLDPLVVFRGDGHATTRRLASTIIHASETGSDALLRAVIGFFAALTKRSNERAKIDASRIVEWARIGGGLSKLPPPFRSPEACNTARQNFERNRGGRDR